MNTNLSLKQVILSNQTTAQTQIDSLRVDVAEAVAFHKNIIHDDANVAELANRVSSNAGNITSLQSTTASQAGEIATITSNVANNAQAIADYNTQFVARVNAEQARAEAAELVLTNAVADEVSRAVAADSALSASVAALDASKQPNLNNSSEVNVKQITVHDGVNNKIVNYASIVAIDTGFENVNAAIGTEITRATAAESVLTAAVASESSTARAAELVLTNSLSSEVSRATTAESNLQVYLNNESSRATTAESQLQADLNNEISVARSNEADITAGYTAMVNTEIANRTSADNALSTSIAAETAARTAAYNNLLNNTSNNLFAVAWFSQVLETEGILTAGSYPFCSGNGTPQSAGFGVGIPFQYEIKGYYVQCISTDVSRSVGLRIEHYNDGSTSSPATLANITLNSTGYSKYYVPQGQSLGMTQQSGSVCIKIQSVSTLTDVNARYRVCLFFNKVSTS